MTVSNNMLSYDDPKKVQGKYKQVIAALCVSWVSLIIGYTTAYSSPAQISLEEDLNLTKNQMSWITSLMPLGALAGSLFGGSLIEYLGRKWTILVTDILFLISWAILFFADDLWDLYISRALGGVAVGITSLTVPVYLAETSQPKIRGTLGLLPTALGNVGILLCYVCGMFFKWKELAMVGIIISIPFMVFFIWIIPESPRWLLTKGKTERSKESLQWLRGKLSNTDNEFSEMSRHQEHIEEHVRIIDLFSRNNIKVVFIVIGLMFFQQMSGIDAVIFYCTKIFKSAGSSLDKSYCTTIVGLVNFISTFSAALIIDKVGRKVLLYISAVMMIFSLFTLGGYFYFKKHVLDVPHFEQQYGWMPLAVFIIYVLGFSLGFGPIPWLMMGEILPANIKSAAASVSTGFNYVCMFIVTKSFLLIIDAIGEDGTYWMYGSVVVIAILFIATCVPETRGHSLHDIEKKLERKQKAHNKISPEKEVTRV